MYSFKLSLHQAEQNNTWIDIYWSSYIKEKLAVFLSHFETFTLFKKSDDTTEPQGHS